MEMMLEKILAKIMFIFIVLLAISIQITIPKENNATNNEQYKILLITAVATRSHKNFFMGTVKALAAKNHLVTVLSKYKESRGTANVRDLVLEGPDMNILLSNPFNNSGHWGMFRDLMSKPAIYCTKSLGLKEVQDLKDEKFDLIIMSPWGINDCFFSLVHHFKVPYVFISPNVLFPGTHHMVGSIHFESLTPNWFLESSTPPTYMDRLKSAVLNSFSEIGFRAYTLPRIRSICQEAGLCPADMPQLKDFYDGHSLVIINSVKALEEPHQPWMPHIIHAGGIHCHPAKPLPKDLEEWIEDSGEEGFIFFSLGSSVHPSNMPDNYRDIFLNVFASLKFKVLWKWDQENIDGLPANVKLSKWLPQQDILGHSKVRLFITHGGLLSLQEATYHSVPVLAMPLFLDQFNNVKEMMQKGWGDKMEWSELSEHLLRSKIVSAVESEEMRRVVQRRAAIMRDRLNEPADLVTYWIEYVIRQNGAPHLMSPISKLYLWELYNIDVWLLLSSIAFFSMAMSILICKKLITKLFRLKPKID